MSSAPASRSSLPASPAQPTLPGLRDQILADKALPLRKRQDVTSALHTLARALGKRPEEIPAHPGYIRDRLKGFTPAMAGLKPGRWNNVMTLFRFARKHLGLARVPGRYKEPLAPDWAELYRHVNGPHMRYGLSRLAHYCSVGGIAPEQVDDQVIGAFVQDLERRGHRSRPRFTGRPCPLNRAWPPFPPGLHQLSCLSEAHTCSPPSRPLSRPRWTPISTTWRKGHPGGN